MNRMPSILLLAVWFFLVAVQPLWSTDRQDRLEEGHQAFQNGNYLGAIEQYESLVQEGCQSVILFYNLGNAYYRAGQSGKAILYYEKARLLRPGDPDVRHNLRVARSTLKDDIAPLPAFFLARWWDALRQQMPSDAWTVLGLIFLWLGAGSWIVWIWGASRTRKKQGFVLGLVLVLISLMLFTLAFSRKVMENKNPFAIVVAGEVVLRSAPDPESAEVQLLHEGLKVKKLDRIGEWYKVRLPNGEEGWLLPDGFAEIALQRKK